MTNGERSGLVALAARTDEGISCFMVEKEPGRSSGGITVSRNIAKLGYKGIETVEMTYDDHRVPLTRWSVSRAAACRTSSARSRRAGSTSRPVRSASDVPRSTPRSRTRSSA